jgi:hypothetical protein
VQLLGLGYDGVVNPTPYLDAWQRLQDIRFSSAGAFLPGLVRLTSTRRPSRARSCFRSRTSRARAASTRLAAARDGAGRPGGDALADDSTCRRARVPEI